MADDLLFIDELQQALGIRFAHASLLVEALTHASYVNESSRADAADNQRLEFLGDAVVGFVVAQWVYAEFPEAREGELTGLRAHLVRTESLAALAEELGLGTHLRMGRGEAAGGGRTRAANLCAAFEALAGALYLDQGLDVVMAWLKRLLASRLAEARAQVALKDPKSRLQELAQAQLHITPAYQIIDQEGPDHARRFTAQVLFGQEVVGTGTGNSKQAAQQAAALEALARLDATGEDDR